jgi:hypothetical protein
MPAVKAKGLKQHNPDGLPILFSLAIESIDR